MSDTGQKRGAATLAAALTVFGWLCGSLVLRAQATMATAAGPQGASGKALYESACMSCHGPDGRGMPISTVGFDVPLPDFSECAFATPEADDNWLALVQRGGRARGFARTMPAFGEVLTREQILSIIAYLRSFCTDAAWPPGDLNLPRPLVTDKAFLENEAVMTTTVEGSSSVSNVFVYEHRIGARTQWELVVPLNMQKDGSWEQGLGDVAFAMKRALVANRRTGSIFSAGGEVIFPTGKESLGLGGGLTIFEPFALYGQQLPRNGFLHVHAGMEFPAQREEAHDEAYWRSALGWSFSQDKGTGRTWSPMLELLAARELGAGEPTLWDVVPQMQVTLSRRQHIMVSGGVQFPLNERENRSRKVMFYFLWDWFDGGLFSGW